MFEDNIWLENKYVMLVSSRLRNFKKKSALKNIYNFACPFCGDSESDKRKSRGYIFPKKGNLRYFCHKCNVSSKFAYFLKEIDSNLYRSMLKERLVSKPKERVTSPAEDLAFKMKTPKFVKGTALSLLPKISSLPINHPAKQYIDKRKIPSKQHFKLFYCDKFKVFVNGIIPDKFESVEMDDERIIIPFLDENKNLIGFQGRSLDHKSKLRYITIMIQEESSKVWGLDEVDKTKTVYLTEGPFDAMFLPNSIAAAGGKLTSTITLTKIPRRNIVVVYDNEPRSPHIMRQNKVALESGFRVCIWPDNIEQKDINEMFLAGVSQDQIKHTIDTNTYAGMQGLLVLNQRKKCDIDEGKRNGSRTI